MEYFKDEWLEAGLDPHLSPTMFQIEQGPHSKLAAHFHRQNEFLVVVEVGGTFGAHDVQATTVHYARVHRLAAAEHLNHAGQQSLSACSHVHWLDQDRLSPG